MTRNPSQRKHKVTQVVRHVTRAPWQILPEALDPILDVLRTRSAGGEFTREEIAERLAAKGLDLAELEARREQEEPAYMIESGGIAVVSMEGILAPKMTMMMAYSGGTSTQKLVAAVRQAVDDPKVGAIVLEVDSPGGYAMGNEEAWRAIRQAASHKRIVAVANGDMASAAYYIASAVGRGNLYASPSSWAGSIGTVTVHADYSVQDANAGVKFTVIRAGDNKWVPNEYDKLDKQGESNVQAEIDQANAQFVQAVATGRGVSTETVLSDFGQGKYFIASEAKQRDLIDQVATLDDVIAELAAELRKPAQRAALNRKENHDMDSRITEALRDRQLIDEDATTEMATATLTAFYRLQGEEVPESTDQILADLASDEEKREKAKQEREAAEAAARQEAEEKAAAEKAEAEAAERKKQEQTATEKAVEAEADKHREILSLVALTHKGNEPVTDALKQAGDLLSGSLEEARQSLLEAVCNDRPPVGDNGGSQLGKATPEDGYRKEYESQKKTMEQLGVTAEEYIETRKMDTAKNAS